MKYDILIESIDVSKLESVHANNLCKLILRQVFGRQSVALMAEKPKKSDSTEVVSEKNETDPVILIKRMNEGDASAFDEISKKYEPLIKSVCSSFESSIKEAGGNGAVAELRQELDITLYRSANTYDIGRIQVTFGKYAKRCLTNCAISQLRKVRAARRKHERAVIKLENKLRSERPHHTFDTYFADYDQLDRKKILDRISFILSSYEFTVFNKYLDGMSAGEIAAELGTDEKSVNNAVYRSKRKVSGMLKKHAYIDDGTSENK